MPLDIGGGFSSTRYRRQEPPSDTRPGRGSAGGGGGATGSSRTEERRRRPLGVPDNYTTLSPSGRDFYSNANDLFGVLGAQTARSGTDRNGNPRTTNTMTQGPRYWDGDEVATAPSNPDQVLWLQQALVNAGLLDPNSVTRYSVFDEPTRGAYKALLEYANQKGMTWQEALADYTAGVELTPGDPNAQAGDILGFDENGNPIYAEPPPFVAPALQLQLPNRDDVKEVFRQATVNLVGVGWTDEQLERATNSYIWNIMGQQVDTYHQEVDRMESEYNYESGISEEAPKQGEPITSIETPNPEMAITRMVREQDPEAMEEYSGLQLLMDMIGGFG